MWLHAKFWDITIAIKTLRYYAGWSDKLQGKTMAVGIVHTSQAYIMYQLILE